MDFDMFAIDLKKEAVKMPRDLIEVLQKLAAHFGPTLEKAVPEMMKNMMSHIEAIMFESAAGILDKRQLEKTISDVLKEVLRDGQASRSAG